MPIKDDIKTFYNKQAGRFHITRRKHWPELQFILNEIEKLPSQDIKILELWCGDGRFYRYIKEHSSKDIKYIWVDMSENLIEIAKMHTEEEDKKNCKFVASEMWFFLDLANQAEFDVVVAIASFQHIPTNKERAWIIKNIYKTLKYEWYCIMINWSFSKWFTKKYLKSIIKAIIKNIFSLWYRKINDLYIPWKDEKVIYQRYYHIFFLKELVSLFKLWEFIIRKNCFIDKNWKLSENWKDARNTIIVVEKDIL